MCSCFKQNIILIGTDLNARRENFTIHNYTIFLYTVAAYENIFVVRTLSKLVKMYI